MKRLNRLQINHADVYDACISGIKDPALARRLSAARAEVISCFEEYERLASTHQLFSFAASEWGNETQQVLAGISKKEFVDLYSVQMVGEEKPGRLYYDRLMMLAPMGKCPLCGFGQAETLDHFLSKARYPAFSVLCINLLPACASCNKGKGSSVLTEEAQILHPYFEEAIIEAESWLFAEVVESTPATVRYFVQPPNHWPHDLIQRILNYFTDLDLARRFAVEAAAEIAGLTALLDDLETNEARQAHLQRVARIERRDRKNSWKAALYEALAESNWFQDAGYCSSLH
jgi:hypothetical protein